MIIRDKLIFISKCKIVVNNNIKTIPYLSTDILEIIANTDDIINTSHSIIQSITYIWIILTKNLKISLITSLPTLLNNNNGINSEIKLENTYPKSVI